MLLNHFKFFLSIVFFSFYLNGIKIKIIEPTNLNLNKATKTQLSSYWNKITKSQKNRSIFFDETNIWLTGSKKEINEFKNFLKKIDKKIKKIKIDILAFIANPQFFKNFGINWSGIYNRLSTIEKNNINFGFVGTGGRINDIPTPTKPVVEQEQSGEKRTYGNLYVNPQDMSINLFNLNQDVVAELAETNIPIVFGGSNLNKERLTAIINSYETNINIFFATKSTYIMDENSLAKFTIGESIPFYTQIIDSTFTNTTLTNTTSQNLSQLYYKNIGVNIQVIPKINYLDEIDINILVETIFPKKGNIVTIQGLNPNPLYFYSNKLKNRLNIKNQEAVFMLLDTSINDVSSNIKIPYLNNNIPLIQNVFRSNSIKNEQLNFYVMIKCTILN